MELLISLPKAQKTQRIFAEVAMGSNLPGYGAYVTEENHR